MARISPSRLLARNVAGSTNIKSVDRYIGVLQNRVPRGLQYCAPFSDIGCKELLKGLPPATRTATSLLTGTRYGYGIASGTTAASIVSYKMASALVAPISIEILWYEGTVNANDHEYMWAATTTNGATSSPFLVGYTAGNLFVEFNSTLHAGGAIVANTLYQVIATLDAGGNYAIYQNNVLVASGTDTLGANMTFFGTGSPVLTTDQTAGTKLLINIANVVWTPAEVAERWANPYGFMYTEVSNQDLVGTVASTPTWGFDEQNYVAIRRKTQPAAARLAPDDPIWPFTAIATPTQFGWDNPEVFAPHKRVVLRNPYTDEVIIIPPAGVTPTQFGWNLEPQFPIRRKPRPFQPDEPPEQWPFTATVTPTQYGWHIEPEFPIRRRPQPFQPDEPPEIWPFTATPTPAQFGWDVLAQFPVRHSPQHSWADPDVLTPPTTISSFTIYGWQDETQFPVRRRPRLFYYDEPAEQWPFTATVTPTQFGWNVEPEFPIRRHPRMFQPDEPPEIWPFTSIITPTQYGWNVEPEFPIRRHPHLALGDPDLIFVAPVIVPPTGFLWDDPQFPVRVRHRLYQPDEPAEQWPFTITRTPTQLGFDTPEQTPVRRRPIPLLVPYDFEVLPTAPTPPPGPPPPIPPVVPGAVGYVLFDFGPFLGPDQFIRSTRQLGYLTRLTLDPRLTWIASTPFVVSSPTTGLPRQAVQVGIYQNIAANYLTCVAIANDGSLLTATGVPGNAITIN